jgi:hypothetical protein
MKLKRYYISDAYGEMLKKISEWRRNVEFKEFFQSSTINMLFLELNTLKPFVKTLEKVWKKAMTQNYCIELSK